MTKLGRNIKAEMARRELTRKDMAKAIGAAVSTWDKHIADPDTRISAGELLIIAKRLGVSVGDLYE